MFYHMETDGSSGSHRMSIQENFTDTARWKWGDIRLVWKLGLHRNCNFFFKLKDAFDHRLHRAGKAF